jgi:predicted O-methyltransferase YrrM
MIDGNLLRAPLRWARRLQRRWLPTRLDRIAAVPGWTQNVQLRFLMRAVRRLPDPSRIVELGVWQGRSALAMAEACRGTGKRVFAIDPWCDYDEGGGDVSGYLARYGVSSFEEVFQSFVGHCQALGLAPWVVTMRQASGAAATTWSEGPISLLFIDANHHYDAVTADLRAWAPHVEPGALICGDDWNWDSVRAAVRDFVARHPDYRLELPCANTWALLTPRASRSIRPIP